jgi:CubicO group peptidase (beta-lactamase class C family)
VDGGGDHQFHGEIQRQPFGDKCRANMAAPLAERGDEKFRCPVEHVRDVRQPWRRGDVSLDPKQCFEPLESPKRIADVGEHIQRGELRGGAPLLLRQLRADAPRVARFAVFDRELRGDEKDAVIFNGREVVARRAWWLRRQRQAEVLQSLFDGIHAGFAHRAPGGRSTPGRGLSSVPVCERTAVVPFHISRRQFLISAGAVIAPRLLSAASEAAPDVPALAAAMSAYMAERRIPGGQLALGNRGKIILSQGFGLADRDKALAVRPATLFRIASVSKPLTAVAVLCLVEDGKLSLDTKMLDALKVGIFLPGKKKSDPRLRDITVRHLLQHTAGWDRDRSGDPMFQSPQIAKNLDVACPPGPRDVIREVLGRPLDFVPGERYAYSNFGYCILGRIIEDLCGEKYEAFVKRRVLAPAGIAAPRLGATLTQAEGESRYYMPDGDAQEGRSIFPGTPEKVPPPYGAWCIEAMDAHGGWLSSAEDMVRFAMSLDDIGRTSPFKKRETWDALIAPPPGAPGHDKQGQPLGRSYGCGFTIRRGGKGVSLDHNGSLPGTTTTLYRRADGFAWAAFFNQRGGGKDGAIVTALNAVLER